MYKTEFEARLHYAVCLLRYAGTKEGTYNHVEILANYNRITPLPRNHKATSSDSWCAIFVNGSAWSLGYRNFPWECSCTNIRARAKSAGIWNEGWSSTPQIGQWVIYDWKNDGKMDHIGSVCWINGNTVYVIEGNYDDSVKIRALTVGDSQVEGFVDLDFTELVDGSGIGDIEALRPGDASPRVRFLQSTLKGAGYYTGELDASYGPLTKDAVVAFQSANSLEPDGKAGPKTMAAITSGKFVVKKTQPAQNSEPKEDEHMKVFDTIDQLPAWAQNPISELVKIGVINGVGGGRLGLTEETVRLAVMLHRGMDRIAEKCGIELE